MAASARPAPGRPVSAASRLRWLAIALLLLWLAFVLASYYIVQNAFLQPVLAQIRNVDRWLPLVWQPESLVRTLLDLLVGVWIALAALGGGRWILSRLRPPDLDPLEEILFGAGLGFGLLGLAVLLFGLLGWLDRAVLVGLLVALSLPTARPTYALLRRAGRPRPPRRVALLLAAAFGLALALALLPPTSWDGLFYHLTGPKLYLEAGIIRPGTDIPHLNFPSLFEMLFLLAMGVRGDASAVVIHFIFALLLAGLVYSLIRRLLPAANPWLAVLFLVATPMVLILAGWAYNDLALAFCEVAALYALLRWRPASPVDPAPVRWLALAGILVGLAMGFKYTSAVGALSLGLLVLWWHRGRWAAGLRALLLFSALALAVAAPWYLKNQAFTGNPVYPFLFGGRLWDDFRAAAYAESGTGIAFNPATCRPAAGPLFGQHAADCRFDPTYLAGRLLTLPYDLTLELPDASRDGPSGPLYLVFLPLLLFYGLVRRRDRPPAFRALLYFALFQLAFWTAGVAASASLWQSRLLLPAFVALCPALAWLLADLGRFDTPRFSLRRQLLLVIGLVLVVGLAIQLLAWLPHQPWAYLTGSETAEANLGRRLGDHYAAMTMVNERVGPAETVVFWWEPRSYYCRVDCRPDSILDAFGHLEFLHGDAAGIAAALAAGGVDYVLINHRGLDFILEANAAAAEPLAQPEILRQLMAAHLEPIAAAGGGAYALYRLRP